MYTGEFLYARWMEDFVTKYLFKTWSLKGEEKDKLIEDIFKTHYPALIEQLDATLLDCNRFIFGNRLSMYDFYIAGFFVNVVQNEQHPLAAHFKKSWDETPNKIKDYVREFKKEMKGYLDSRTECMF